MKQYLLSVCLVDDGTPPPSPEEIQPTYEAVGAFNDRLMQSGAWVFAGGLHPRSTATVVRSEAGEKLITDGPFAEGKEYVGGFWVIKADDLDAALGWAGGGGRACGARAGGGAAGGGARAREVRPREEAPGGGPPRGPFVARAAIERVFRDEYGR